MRWILLGILSSLAVFGLVTATSHRNNEVRQRKSSTGIAVIELFTSEGCSSCPPADRLLPNLAVSDQNIVPLSYHVDYWNRFGWKDPFSNSEFSLRQQQYGKHFNLESIYTPQLVVNGEYELVGSNKSAAQATIAKVLNENTATHIAFKDEKIAANTLLISCMLEGQRSNSTVIAALVQKHAETKVRAGENSGATLTHVNVVRVFQTQPAKNEVEFNIRIPPDLTKDENQKSPWKLVVYTQQADLKITGVAVYDPSH